MRRLTPRGSGLEYLVILMDRFAGRVAQRAPESVLTGSRTPRPKGVACRTRLPPTRLEL
jgi:hypothetical protein